MRKLVERIGRERLLRATTDDRARRDDAVKSPPTAENAIVGKFRTGYPPALHRTSTVVRLAFLAIEPNSWFDWVNEKPFRDWQVVGKHNDSRSTVIRHPAGSRSVSARTCDRSRTRVRSRIHWPSWWKSTLGLWGVLAAFCPSAWSQDLLPALPLPGTSGPVRTAAAPCTDVRGATRRAAAGDGGNEQEARRATREDQQGA